MDRFRCRWWYKGKMDYDSPSPVFVESGPCLPPGGAPMLCTGQKDKNGRLIYEDDIISLYSITSIVAWGGLVDESGWHAYGWVLHGDASHAEVIGNVHENPDLLASSFLGSEP